MIQVINHPPAGSNLWEATIFADLEELATVDKAVLKFEEFGVMVGNVYDDPIVALRELKTEKLAVTGWGDFPSDFDHMEFLGRWFRAAKINHLGSFFLQISKIPQTGAGFPVTYMVTNDGKIFEDSYAIGCPYPKEWE